jgi:CheY-like chemotaxis protein
VRNVHDSGRHLLKLINELLDLSKIEAGRLEVTLASYSARTLATEALASVQPLAQAAGLDLGLAPGGGEATVTADAARLKQALLNLLSNAIKFTPAGGRVRVTVGPAPEADLVRLAVRDDGPGIALEDQARLFQEFTQLAPTEGRGGTGLGLALTRRLVGLMGGRVGVDSAPGHGSTFYLDLPVGDAVAGAELAPAATRGPLVLVVEDDPPAQELMALMLADNGYRARVVATAEEGLAEARRLSPDVITIDVFLPTLDGWDLLRLLKADPRTASIPAIIVSISSDRAKAFSLGALEHLVKPVARDALLAALARHRFTGVAPLAVLAIDDDPRQRDLVRAVLEPRGFRVHTEATGRGGLAAAQARPFDLVLLDLMLPDVSGVEVVWQLRADARTRAVPILLVTAHELSASERQRLTGDVQAIISKVGTNAEALLTEIARVLAEARAESAS